MIPFPNWFFLRRLLGRARRLVTAAGRPTATMSAAATAPRSSADRVAPELLAVGRGPRLTGQTTLARLTARALGDEPA